MKDIVRVGNTWAMQFKGLDELIQVYEVRGLDGKYSCSMPEEAPEHFLELDPPLSMECFILEGKTISDKGIVGRIERLSENFAQGVLDGAVEKNMNLKVRITPNGAGALSEVYAKVMEADPTSGNSATRIVLNFTSLPDDAKAFLEKRRTAAL